MKVCIAVVVEANILSILPFQTAVLVTISVRRMRKEIPLIRATDTVIAAKHSCIPMKTILMSQEAITLVSAGVYRTTVLVLYLQI